MKEVLAVLDRDVRFAERLCMKLNTKEDFPYAAVRFRNRGELLEFSGNGRIGVLLLERDAEDAELRRLEVGQRLYLTDVRGYPWVDNVPTVYKYQPVDLFTEELLKKTRMISEGRVIAENPLFRTRYIGVISPVGRCMKTGFALTLGQILGQSAKVLYLNFEQCSGFGAFFGEQAEETLSDVLYEYETGRQGADLLRFVRHFHDLDYIPPVRMPSDIIDTAPDRLKELAMNIAKEGAYDILILDFGTDCRVAESFLPFLSTVYVPMREDELSKEKVRIFREWLREKGTEQLMKQYRELVLPAGKPFTGGKNYPEQLLFGEVGMYVRNLLSGLGMD